MNMSQIFIHSAVAGHVIEGWEQTSLRGAAADSVMQVPVCTAGAVRACSGESVAVTVSSEPHPGSGRQQDQGPCYPAHRHLVLSN